MTKKTQEWQYCDCQDAGDNETLEPQLCGCGKEHGQAILIHWREHHWQWECAFQVLVEENDEMRNRLVKMAVDKVFQRRRNILQDFDKIDET